MFAKAISKVNKAMFPIFAFNQISSTEMNISVAGTGFFINSEGYFVSVAHVFDGPNVNYKYLGLLPENVTDQPLDVVEVMRDDGQDIFIGKLNIKTPNYLRLSLKEPEVGRSVCVAGYPLPRVQANSQGGVDVGGVRRYFQPTFVLDVAQASSVANGITRNHNGFLVRDVGLFGMSGGPIFDISGVVVGMQGSVTAPRVSSNGSRTITVENALAIKSGLVIDFLKQNKVKYNFAANKYLAFALKY